MNQQPPWHPSHPPYDQPQWSQQPPPQNRPPQQQTQYGQPPYGKPPRSQQQPPYQKPSPQYYQQPYHYPPPMMQLPPPQKPDRGREIAGFVIVGIILIVVFVGVANSQSNNGASSTNTSFTNNGSTSSQIAEVGQSITVDNVATTLVSVNLLPEDQYTQPKPGNEFIVVNVQLVNKGSGEVNYNSFDFHVRSGSGNITDEEIPPSTYTANNELNSGKLSPGGTVEGDIIFQVPKNDHQAQLTWQPNFFGNAGDNVWNLGL